LKWAWVHKDLGNSSTKPRRSTTHWSPKTWANAWCNHEKTCSQEEVEKGSTPLAKKSKKAKSGLRCNSTWSSALSKMSVHSPHMPTLCVTILPPCWHIHLSTTPKLQLPLKICYEML
jgi:hypothetical protein